MKAKILFMVLIISILVGCTAKPQTPEEYMDKAKSKAFTMIYEVKMSAGYGSEGGNLKYYQDGESYLLEAWEDDKLRASVGVIDGDAKVCSGYGGCKEYDESEPGMGAETMIYLTPMRMEEHVVVEKLGEETHLVKTECFMVKPDFEKIIGKEMNEFLVEEMGSELLMKVCYGENGATYYAELDLDEVVLTWNALKYTKNADGMEFSKPEPARSLLPDRCQFSTQPVACKRDQFVIRNEGTGKSGDEANVGTIVAKLTNAYGQRIYLYDARITTDYEGVCTDGNYRICVENGSQQDGRCDESDIIISDGGQFEWPEAESHNIVVSCDNGESLSVGSKVKFNIKFRWRPVTASTTFEKDGVGEIYATVQG